MIVEDDVRIAMRDGVELSLRLYLPEGEGPFPALFAASPYQHEYDDIPAYRVYPWRETGPVAWYVEKGYAYVRVDVRGSGRSGGQYGFLDRTEQEDLVEAIAWIVSRPWSNGKVGGIGQSYYGMAQWLLATRNPPGLACIVPYDALIDQYRCNNYHGGIYCQYRSAWYISLLYNNQHRAAGRQNRERSATDLVGDILAHPLNDDWWRERSAFERIDRIAIPVLSIGHWGKMGLHLRGNVLGYELLQSPKKLVVTGATGPQAHHQFDTVEFHEKELLPFYEHHLKGVDNGVMDEPPVRIFIRGAGHYRTEDAWPLPRARYRTFYLRAGPSGSVSSINDGGLSPEPPSAGEGATSYDYPDPLWQQGVVALDPEGHPDPVRRVLTFTSAPLEEDLEVTGPIVLTLHAASSREDTRFIVKLADQHPQPEADRAAGRNPRFSNVSRGWLKASHRKKDEARSTPLRPVYTHADPEPLVPGAVYRFEIEVLPCAHLFRKGHRLRVEIANFDSNLTDALYTHPYHGDLVGTDTILHDAGHPSSIALPVVAGD